ncbi:hypothetical protein AC249_AIPGENE9542 [Exaiptasia diaphana]|nr:hypothetical protein AC249_AIPGENE9542 [Exaiptasia diaphana]
MAFKTIITLTLAFAIFFETASAGLLSVLDHVRQTRSNQKPKNRTYKMKQTKRSDTQDAKSLHELCGLCEQGYVLN